MNFAFERLLTNNFINVDITDKVGKVTYGSVKFTWMWENQSVHTGDGGYQNNHTAMCFMNGYTSQYCCVLEMELDL